MRITEHQAAHIYTYMRLNIAHYLVFFEGFSDKKGILGHKDINHEIGEGKWTTKNVFRPIHNHGSW